MTRKFKKGDHITWNSEAGPISGIIIAVHEKDFYYKGLVISAIKIICRS